MPDSARRTAMVESQLLPNDVTDARLIKAMGEIARERFVPAAMNAVAYMEGCVPLGGGRALLDARSFGKLAQLAAIRATDRVLDIGCGTGYSTAVLAHLAGHVTGLEEDAEFAHAAEKNLRTLGITNAEIVHGALAAGLPDKAPFDVVFVNGAVEVKPAALLSQLRDGGRLVCVMREGAAGQGCVYLKHDGAIGARAAFGAQLPVLPGFKKSLGFVF
jgi:protein-L-isoaspartate(D-aspartate) O-methyltransferase